VNGLGRGKYLIKCLVQTSGKITGKEICLENCSTCLLCQFNEPRTWVTIVTKDTTGNVIAEELVDAIGILLPLQLIQVGSLSLAEDLDGVVAEFLEKSTERKSRPTDFAGGNPLGEPRASSYTAKT